ncbi:uncharacterized protein [Dysidea avara]|uniref:uncharacterized protein n=1 Tax=Dysidea avara TaxID=196820 RepID=UPI00332BAB5A
MRESRETRHPLRWGVLFSTKELFFLISVCVVGAFLFSGVNENAFLGLGWEELFNTDIFENGDFPLDHEKLPQPIVSDIDGDGKPEIILIASEHPGELHLSMFNFKWNDALSLKAKVLLPLAVNSTIRPIAMAAGFTKVYTTLVELRLKVVVVLLSDFTLLCYNHQMKRLQWSTKLAKDMDLSTTTIREPALLVTPTALQPEDKGSIIVGGRLSLRGDPLFRKSEQIREKLNYDSLGHYSVYAVHARDGAMRWKHEPGDFESTLPYSLEEVSSFQHYKLTTHRRVAHVGEVSWQQYSQSLSKALPHSWQHDADTEMRLAHFTKDKKNTDPNLSDHVSKVGDLAKEHMGSKMPSPPTQEDYLNASNVVVIHSQKGVEVLHLFQGRPLCSLPLAPMHTSHADIDADGTIEHMSAILTHPEAGEDQPPTQTAGEAIKCYGKATKMAPAEKVIFKHRICSHIGWLETLMESLPIKTTPFPILDYLPDVLPLDNPKPAHLTGAEALSPVIIKSAHHSGLQLHFSKAAASMNKGIYYDTIFVLNTGRITSIGPHGEINWQEDSDVEWLEGPRDSSANEELFNRVESLYFFVTQTFTPSAIAMSLTRGGVKDHILVVGWKHIAMVNSYNGFDITTTSIPCPPVNRPIVRDFTGDGVNDVILTCRNKYLGIVMFRESGLWNSTIVSVLVGIIILVVVHNVRLKFSNPFVVRKEAID